MKTLLKVIVVGVLSVMLVMPVFAGGGSQRDSGKITFRLSHVFTPLQTTHIVLTDVAKAINERTGGQIEIHIFPDSQLPTGVDGVEQVRRGAYFINMFDPGCMGDWVPDYHALIGPMLYANPEEYSAMAQTEFAQSLNRQAEQHGIKVLALDYNFGMRHVVMSRNQLGSLNDLQGVKIRVPRAQLWIDTFTILGAAPIGMIWAELYNALQTGVVDAFESSLSDIFDNSLFEVSRYITKTSHFVGTGAAMMSMSVWDKLTPEQQQIIQEEFTRGAIRNNEMSALDEADAQAKLEAAGMIVNEIDLSGFRQRSRAWFDNNKTLTPGVYDIIMAELNRIRGN